MKNKSWWNKYSFLWVTGIFFLVSFIGHWIFAWYAFVEEQTAHAQPVEFSAYLVEVLRDTLENWQSEFLQLMWQVAGLAFLFHVGSPQSKEGDDRKEEKLDLILMALDETEGRRVIQALDKKYPRK
ncbi:MAG: DUF6766 family protein [Patescibacteria group bacterium]